MSEDVFGAAEFRNFRDEYPPERTSVSAARLRLGFAEIPEKASDAPHLTPSTRSLIEHGYL
jgi:hypothetical protein